MVADNSPKRNMSGASAVDSHTGHLQRGIING